MPTRSHGAARLPDGGVREFALTRAALYSGAGKPRAAARRANWNAEVAAPFAALSAVTPKTPHLAAFRAYLAVVVATHYDALWDNKLHPRWGREDLRFHILKHKTMDGWLTRVKSTLAASAGGGKTVAGAPQTIPLGL